MIPHDDQRRMIGFLSFDEKRQLAYKWIRRISNEWLRPLLDRLEAPTCRLILANGLEQDVVDGRFLEFLQGHLDRICLHEELTKFEEERDGRGAALRAALHLLSATSRSLDPEIHLAALTRPLILAIRECVPLVRVGGRLVYRRYNDDVYKWVVRCNCDAEEALEHLLQCRDIMDFMPARTEDIGFLPVPLDSALKRT